MLPAFNQSLMLGMCPTRPEAPRVTDEYTCRDQAHVVHMELGRRMEMLIARRRAGQRTRSKGRLVIQRAVT